MSRAHRTAAVDGDLDAGQGGGDVGASGDEQRPRGALLGQVDVAADHAAADDLEGALGEGQEHGARGLPVGDRRGDEGVRGEGDLVAHPSEVDDDRPARPPGRGVRRDDIGPGDGALGGADDPAVRHHHDEEDLGLVVVRPPGDLDRGGVGDGRQGQVEGSAQAAAQRSAVGPVVAHGRWTPSVGGTTRIVAASLAAAVGPLRSQRDRHTAGGGSLVSTDDGTTSEFLREFVAEAPAARGPHVTFLREAVADLAPRGRRPGCRRG